MELKNIILVIMTLVIFQVQTSAAQTKPELIKITDSVYSYIDISPGVPGNAFGANAGIVIGKDAVLVVDTLTSFKEVEGFVADIKKITSKPIKFVVNTHSHLDHALGNSYFANMGVNIVSHVKCRDAIIATGDKILENPDMFGLPLDFWEGTSSAAPNIAFEQEMTIDLGDLTVKLIHSGMTSHSAGSIIVHIPTQNVLFTGDILFTDFHPYLGEGDFPGWEKTLNSICEMNVKNIIPGHGPLSSNKDIDDMKIYLSIFDKKATEMSVVEKDIEKLSLAILKVVPKRTNGNFIITMNLKARYLKNNVNEQIQDKY
ncbi:MAG: MBL fold metallo-hydrolase [Desulfobacteraceae bacterium]|nr:MBL fold metallo-hydrolase [Desulfobacteraceae bacterium]